MRHVIFSLNEYVNVNVNAYSLQFSTLDVSDLGFDFRDLLGYQVDSRSRTQKAVFAMGLLLSIVFRNC